MEIVCRPETYRRFESSSLRQQKTHPFLWVLFCLITRIEEDSRGEPRTRVSVLPANPNNRPTLKAKQTIDNRLAGRTAKGENPLLCANKNAPILWVLFLFDYENRRGFEGGAANR